MLNRLFPKVQNILQSPKVYRGNYEKLKTGIDSRRINFSCGENVMF